MVRKTGDALTPKVSAISAKVSSHGFAASENGPSRLTWLEDLNDDERHRKVPDLPLDYVESSTFPFESRDSIKRWAEATSLSGNISEIGGLIAPAPYISNRRSTMPRR